MAVSATFNFDPAEHYRALRAVTRLTPLRWIGLVCFLILPTVTIGLTALVARAAGRDIGAALSSTVPYVLLFFFWGTLIPFTQRRRSKRLAKLDPSVQGVQERTIDAEGYHSRGNGVALAIPWHALTRAVETPTDFLFFYNWQCAYYLPKRALNATQIVQVREFATAALGQRAELQTS